MTSAEIATALRRAQSFAALPPADVPPLLGLAQLASEALRTRDLYDGLPPESPDILSAQDAMDRAEAALREAIAPVLEDRLTAALSTVGAEHEQGDGWQRRVWARIEAEPTRIETGRPRPSWWLRAWRWIGGGR